MAGGEQPSEGPLTLQPHPAEANGATATTPASGVGLPEPQATNTLLSCAGTLWFCTAWWGASLSRDGSNKNVPPHRKHASERKKVLMIGTEQTLLQPPDSHTKESCCIYEVFGVAKISWQKARIPSSGLCSFLLALFEILRLLKVKLSCWLSSHSNPRFHFPLKQHTTIRSRSLFYPSRVFPSK